MDSLEIEKELNMDLQELYNYLKNKYGLAKENYFLDESCNCKSSVNGRGYEGLFLHHDLEWNPADPTAHKLSDSATARLYNYEYQQKEHLTYCNLLEHLIIHVKINLLRAEAEDCTKYEHFKDGLLTFLIPEVNAYYYRRMEMHTKKTFYKQQVWNQIKDNWKDYLKIVEYWIERQYQPETKAELKKYLRKLVC